MGARPSRRAQSPQTVKVYGDGVRAFLTWCEREGHTPELNRRLMTGFIAGLLEAGAKPSTAAARQLGCRRFSHWLVEEDEVPVDQLIGIKIPKIDTAVVEPLNDHEVKLVLVVTPLLVGVGAYFSTRWTLLALVASVGVHWWVAAEAIRGEGSNVDPLAGLMYAYPIVMGVLGLVALAIGGSIGRNKRRRQRALEAPTSSGP